MTSVRKCTYVGQSMAMAHMYLDELPPFITCGDKRATIAKGQQFGVIHTPQKPPLINLKRLYLHTHASKGLVSWMSLSRWVGHLFPYLLVWEEGESMDESLSIVTDIILRKLSSLKNVLIFWNLRRVRAVFAEIEPTFPLCTNNISVKISKFYGCFFALMRRRE